MARYTLKDDPHRAQCRVPDDDLRELLARVKDDWREGERYASIISDGDTGWDDDENVDAYSGHMVCESVKSPMIRALICLAPSLAAEVLELRAEVARLNASIKRQAGAARSIQATTAMIAQNENERLRGIDRSEYNAAAALESERAANAMLTGEIDALQSTLTAEQENADRLAGACKRAKTDSRRAYNLTENFHNVLGAVSNAVSEALAAHMKMRGK